MKEAREHYEDIRDALRALMPGEEFRDWDDLSPEERKEYEQMFFEMEQKDRCPACGAKGLHMCPGRPMGGPSAWSKEA